MLNQFCLRMGTELVPETLYSNELTRLCAREDYIELRWPVYWWLSNNRMFSIITDTWHTYN
jgi:hypothetical protein